MIKKIIFKNEVKEILLDLILKGEIKPGQRISLPSMASKLDVSVTPIREALTQLSETGIVRYVANRGFLVSELSTEEAREIYELMIILEGNAVKKSQLNIEQTEELVAINNKMAKAKSSIDILKFDRQFHQKLIENYKNKSGLRIIETLRVRVSIYEYAFWNESQKAESLKMHNLIINHIKNNNLTSVQELIEQNWMISINHILKKLEPSN